MCVFIGMEDLAANALIEMLERSDVREVSFEALYKYGIMVVELLERGSERVVLLLSRHYTSEFIRNYSDYFFIRKTEEGDMICLHPDVSSTDLRKLFRAYISIDLLLALVNEKSLSKLGVAECQAS